MKLLGGIVELFSTYLNELFSTVGLTLDMIFYLGIGFEVLMIIFFLIKSRFAYEGRLGRQLDKLNKWLYYNQNIGSNNLIAFNQKMKKSPKTLRYYWQQYMLYREHSPSYYMSTYNCIEKPLHTSSYNANIKNLQAINWATIIVTFVLGIAADLSTTNILSTVCTALIVPMIVCILNAIFLMILRSMQNYNLSSLYQNFHLFQRYIDKATTTLPEYVDFEVLFTQKEIKQGIPVLNEYLEKRARQEQEELEKARLYAVEHEKYDFSKSGINGALVLDRAMKETEIYLNVRQRLLSEIQQLDSEIDSKKRNYENISKDYQRKMQASKENVERLRTQQEETTNRIESNYIKKQQGDEIKKQEQLDKDQEDATVKFNHEIETLQAEIEKRRTDLENRKAYVEEAMLAEYQTFSEKVYKDVSKTYEEQVDAEKKEILDEKDTITDELNDAHATINYLNKEIENLRKIIANAGIEEGKHGGFYSDALKEEADRVKTGKHNSKKSKKEEVYVEQPVEIQEQEVYAEPVEEQLVEQAEETQNNEEGYYDDQGYYWYPNGTYYDDKGYYHDENGGYYDTEGNYFPPEEQQPVEQEVPAEEPVVEEQQPVEEAPVQEEQQVDEYGGYYDEEGYYRYPNGTYYDPEGNYHDENGGYYDPNGNYFPPVNEEELIAPYYEEETPAEAQEEPVVEQEVQPEVQEEVNQVVEEPVEELPIETEEAIDLFEEDGIEGLNAVIVEEEQQPEEKPAEVQEQEVEQPVEVQEEQPTEEVVEDVNEEPVEEQPKRKAGRPRKVVTEEPKEKRGRGRPKKVVAEPAPTEEKRGRGRPKKVQEEPKEEVSAEPKKSRGRPKKTEEVKPAEEKRGRGRPKKKTLTETVDELSAISRQIKEEQAKILKEQQELSNQIGIALGNMNDDSSNQSSADEI